MGCSAAILGIDGRGDYDKPLPGEGRLFFQSYTLGPQLQDIMGDLLFLIHQSSGLPDGGRTLSAKLVRLAPLPASALDNLRAARQEAAIWQSVGQSQHCMELLTTFADVTGIYVMVAEAFSRSLLDLICCGQQLDDQFLVQACGHILHGLRHLHGKGIVHRGLRAHRVLIAGKDRNVLKLSGFSCSAVLPRTGWLTEVCDSRPYASPEMAKGLRYNTKTDLWSFGAIACELLFCGSCETPEAFLDYEKQLPSGWPSHRIGPLVRAVLARNHMLRSDAEQALRIIHSTCS